MSRLARILLFCIDSGDAGLIRDWAEAGELPTFLSLLTTGRSMPVKSLAGLYAGANWPSFYGGVSPGRHGRYFLEQIIGGSYSVGPFDDEDASTKPFWDLLAEAGYRVAVVDVPKAPLSKHGNVTQVAYWGTADRDHRGFRTQPGPLAEDLAGRFGLDPVGISDSFQGAEAMEPLRDSLLARVAAKEAILTDLLRQGDWDLFIGSFASCHCAGHMMWHLHDRSHPLHDPQLAARLGDPLLQTYRAIDSSLGRLIDMSGEDVTVMVYGSSGMGPRYTGNHLLDEVLRRLEQAPPPRWGLYRRSLKGIRHLLPWYLLPNRLRTSGRALSRAMEDSSRVGNRRHRLAFQLPTNEHASGIRVNLRGREPEGKIDPGAAYEAFCKALSDDLCALRNLDTGRPAVHAVLRSDDAYPGERRNYLPDLLVEWSREAPIERLGSEKIGEIAGALPGFRTGDHTSEGFMVVRGPGIPAGRFDDAISLMDIAPTIAAVFGVSMSSCDGQAALAQAGFKGTEPEG